MSSYELPERNVTLGDLLPASYTGQKDDVFKTIWFKPIRDLCGFRQDIDCLASVHDFAFEE